MRRLIDNIITEKTRTNPLNSLDLFLWTRLVQGTEWQARPFDIPILQLLSYALTGRVSRIMVSIPPQHGKSTFITESFLSYLMVNCPDENVILASYNQGLATELGGNIKDIVNYYSEYTIKKPTIRDDTKSKHKFKFDLPYKGRLLARGSTSGITGFEANILVIDDPIKDFQDAHSVTLQNKLENWYKATIQMRLRKRGKGKLPPIVILVAQRLHERDLHGIIKENEPSIKAKEALQILENGGTIPEDTWVDLNLPGICTDPENDILGRKQGEVLWPQHRDYNNLMSLKRSVGSYIFETQIQGNPQPLRNYIFKHQWFYKDDTYDDSSLTCTIPYNPEMEWLPKGRFWDLAGRRRRDEHDVIKPGEGDYYAGIHQKWDAMNGDLLIRHMERGKAFALDVANLVEGTIVSDGLGMHTQVEQEPASMSGLFMAKLSNEYIDYDIDYQPARTKKSVRAVAVKGLAEFGHLKFIVEDGMDLEWVHTIIRELERFDGRDSNPRIGKHDDIMDSLSLGANYFQVNPHLF